MKLLIYTKSIKQTYIQLPILCVKYYVKGQNVLILSLK